eukprot:SAG11_NODE_35463_length_266_cov_0.934132_1_plen_46_part_01
MQVAAKFKAGSKAQKDALKRAKKGGGGSSTPFADLVFFEMKQDDDI